MIESAFIVAFVSLAFMMFLALTAPFGDEDENGFHLGDE